MSATRILKNALMKLHDTTTGDTELTYLNRLCYQLDQLKESDDKIKNLDASALFDLLATDLGKTEARENRAACISILNQLKISLSLPVSPTRQSPTAGITLNSCSYVAQRLAAFPAPVLESAASRSQRKSDESDEGYRPRSLSAGASQLDLVQPRNVFGFIRRSTSLSTTSSAGSSSPSLAGSESSNSLSSLGSP